jgi:putative photosynthetic complex assembly protein 2
VIHHEVALAVTLVVLIALTWGAPNRVAAWTFLVLWALRLSAKLNLFFGVRNVTEEFVPARLRYLVSYFRRTEGRVNPLLTASLVAGAGVAAAMSASAFEAEAGFMAVGETLVLVLLLLGLLEHLFLAFPMREARLWRWVLGSVRGPAESPTSAASRPLTEALAAAAREERALGARKGG